MLDNDEIDDVEEKDKELNALLGKTLDLTEIVKSAKKEPSGEITQLDANSSLEDKILFETNDIMQRAKYAVADVLMQVQTTPSDGELVAGAAKLLNSYNMIIDNLQKIYITKEKFKQQVRLQSMKLMADDKINQDNNNTRVMLSREQLLAALTMNNTKGKVIENEHQTQQEIVNREENESKRTEKEV